MKLLYFSWVRERVGLAEEDLQLPQTVNTVHELLTWLTSQSQGHALALSDVNRLRIAVNQSYVQGSHEVSDDDEIAIFPPVTGG
jgi:sulfur-carrier protein